MMPPVRATVPVSKSILSTTSTIAFRQLESDEDTPTTPLNAAILQRYEDKHIAEDSSEPARPQCCLEVVKLLLDSGFNPHDKGPDGIYGQPIIPIALAAQVDDVEMVQLLLDTDIGAHAKILRLFLVAAEYGCSSVLQTLINWSAKHRLVIPTQDQHAAFRSAAAYRFPENLRILFRSFPSFPQTLRDEALLAALRDNDWDYQTDFTAKFFDRGEDDLWQAQIETVHVLLGAGSDVNCTDQNQKSALYSAAQTARGADTIHLLLDHDAKIDTQLKRPYHLLTAAVQNGNKDLVRALLVRGATILPADPNSGRTLLHAAAGTLSPDASLETIKELVAAGLDPIQAGADQWTPFHFACKGCRVDVMQYFLSLQGPEIVNQGTRNGWTPLNITFHSSASHMSQGQAIHFLLQHGADVNVPAPDNERYTPLHMAASTHGADMLELLFRHGAKVCASDVTGETALHLMQDDFDLDGIRMLLRFGADVNAQDKEGTTLLHKVMKLNPGYIRRGIVDFLLEVGADARTGDGWEKCCHGA